MSNRDSKRLKAIRKMICCACGADAPSQAAHSNFGIHGKGKGIKADDKYTIPLCHDCHRRFDQYMDMDRDKSRAWFGRMLNKTDRQMNQQPQINGVDF